MKFKAFTLVELLVVMAIISFLSVGAFAGLSFGLRQARDVQRKKIVDLAHVALQAYYSDFNSYPKTTAAGCNQSVSGVTATGWGYCTGAFPEKETETDSFVYALDPNGFKDKLEGEWPTGSNTSNPNSVGGNDLLRYFYFPASGAKPTKFAVCISVENKNGGNVTAKNSNKKDCYCVGADYLDLQCAGMTSISN